MDKITISDYRNFGNFKNFYQFVKENKGVKMTPMVREIYWDMKDKLPLEILIEEEMSKAQRELLNVVIVEEETFGEITGFEATFIHEDTIQFNLPIDIRIKFELGWEDKQKKYKEIVRKVFKDKHNIELKDIAVWSKKIRIGIK